MTKREEREQFFKLLFMGDFYPKEQCENQLDNFIEDNDISEEQGAFRDRFLSFLDVIEDIDATIEKATVGWKISRMAKVDLALLRMAVFEMRYEKLDVGIAINEAVELAKVYGGERSYAFVNGVLANIED